MLPRLLSRSGRTACTCTVAVHFLENRHMNFVKMTTAAALLALGATVAMAQTATTPSAPVAPKPPVAATTPPPATTAAPAAKKGAKQATTPEGIACSAEADAKGLHGKERTKFRNACKKDKLKAAGGKAPVAAAKKI